MKQATRRRPLSLALGAFGIAACEYASAGCGAYLPPPADHTGLLEDARSSARLLPVVYRDQSPGEFVRVGDNDADSGAAIVGMWYVTLTSDGTSYPTPIPSGVVFDFGPIQYHSDGTEIQISGQRPPSSGDVCMGVWKQIGPRTYTVKHIGLSWLSADTTPSASPATYLGPGIFHETITLSRSNDSYTGTITIDQYAKDGVTLIEHIGGTMKGVRFTVD